MNNSLFRRKSLTHISKDLEGSDHLVKTLGLRDLVFFGIAAIIGAGIFSTIGKASFNGGPAVSLLFVGVSVACIFTALCYAQFASMVPVSGSAYTYAYVSFGEIFAWIIGWALILEYAVSNMVVAISWSEYFTSMLAGFGILWPEYLSTDYTTAKEAFLAVQSATTNGTLAEVSQKTLSLSKAYEFAPDLGFIKIIFDLPAGLITFLITSLVYRGIKESRTASNIMVVLKLGVIFLVIVAGAFFIKPDNWMPFAPNGVGGVMSGVAAVFFAFIGFDSISTTAEECKDPQRDLPKAMIIVLVICTVLYVLISLVLTGMVNYKELDVEDPLSYVFTFVGMDFVAGIISVSAIVAITSALLVYQLGQPRIWMTMSRDGLLWKRFSKIHPIYKTPSFATVVTGLVVGIPAVLFKMDFFIDLTSVGTFFAFILVCAGVLYLDYKGESKTAKFKLPYINAKYIAGVFFVLTFGYLLYEGVLVASITAKPMLITFWVAWLVLAVLAFLYNLSLLPILGILTNLYLMSELHYSNWVAFGIWLVLGLIVYFGYGYKHSKLRK
jgi:basic amino acid/polyamine antiporter, APA family